MLTKNYDRVNITCKPLGYEENLSDRSKEIMDRVCNLEIKEYKKTRLVCFAECVELFFKILKSNRFCIFQMRNSMSLMKTEKINISRYLMR